MKIVFDADVCACHGQCVSAAPELFAFDDSGKLKVLIEEPPEDLWVGAGDAADVCPTQAITLLT
jgi:ferredoxin